MPSSAPLSAELASLRRRIRLRALWRGLFTLGLMAAGLLAAAVLVDYVFLMGGWTRAAFAGLCGVGVWGLARRQLGAPLTAPLTDEELVLALEERLPGVEERLITLRELSADPAAAVGSARAKEALRRDLEAWIVAFERAHRDAALFDDRWALRRGGALALSAAALVLAAALFPDVRLGLSRWAPGSEARWTRLSLDPVPDAIAAAEELQISGAVGGRVPRSVTLRVETLDADGAGGAFPSPVEGASRIERVAVQDGRFRHALRGRLRPFRLRVEAGDAETGWMRVHVRRAPSVLSVRLRIEPPAYAGRPAAEQEGGEATALEGSRIVVSGEADIPLASGRLALSAGQEIPLEVGAEGRSFRGAFTASADGTYSVRIVSREGVANDPPPVFRIRCVPDRPPTVRWLRPARQDAKAVPAAALRWRASIADDVGLGEAALLHERLPRAGEPGRLPLPLGGAPEQDVSLDLAALGAKEGEVLELRIEAADRRTPAPNRGVSTPVRLRIVPAAELSGEVDAALTRVREALDDAVDRWGEADRSLAALAAGAPEGTHPAAVQGRSRDALALVSRGHEEFTETMLVIDENALSGLYPMGILAEATQRFRQVREERLPRAAEGGADWKARAAASKEALEALKILRGLFLQWEDFNGLVRLAGRSVRDQEEVVRALERMKTAR